MKGNLILNLSASLITFLLTVLISLWMTPFIIEHLGPEAYGFIPLTQNFISALSVFTVALSSIIARYLTVSIHQGDYIKAKGYYNTYVFSAIIISLIIGIIFMILAFTVNKIINVPNYLLVDVRIAIIVSGLLLITTFIGAVYIAAPFCVNKLYLTNGVEALNALIKSSVTFVSLYFFIPKIWYVNMGAFIAGLISFILNVLFFRKILPYLKLNVKQFELSKLKELLGSGFWNSVGQVGVILFLGIDILVANITLGAEKAGIYAAILQIPLLLRSLSSIISGVFAPVIITYYAKNNIRGLIQYSNRAVKLTGLVIALPTALICGLGGAILQIWIGPNFLEYKWLLILNAFYLIFVLSIMPLNHIFTAVNKLKTPAIITIILGIFNLILAIFLSGQTKLELFGIVIAGAATLFLKNFTFIPFYSSYVTSQPFYIYYKGIIQPIIGCIFGIVICIIIQHFYLIETLTSLIIVGSIVSIIYFLFSISFLLNKAEKEIILSYIKKFTS